MKTQTNCSRKRIFIPLVALALCVVFAAGACVEVKLDPKVDYLVMEFDSTSTPPRVPEPNVVAINPQTGLIDFSASGLDLPEDCADASALGLPMAQCEFYQYLETLDGFPTLSPAKAPVSGALDMDTVSVPSTVFVLEDTPDIWSSNDLFVEFDEETNILQLTPLSGWKVGKQYVIAVRGYDDGVMGAQGERVISNQVYFLLKQDESLMCDAAIPSQIPEDCEYLQLLASEDSDVEVARAQLASLEALRAGFVDAGAWESVELLGDIPKEEIAILWAFPTHTGSVAELNPAAGLLPQVEESPDRLLVPVKGTVDASSVSAFHPMANPSGSVYLVDLTELLSDNQAAAFPIHTATYDEAAQAIALEPDSPMVDGHLYVVILSDDLANEGGVPLVPSPVTVFLRSQGELIDGTGTSTVSSLDDLSAADLEAGRAMLQVLLDNPDFQDTTLLYAREQIVYLYAFTFPDPTTSD